MIIVRFFTPDKLVPFYDDYLRLIKTYFVSLLSNFASPTQNKSPHHCIVIRVSCVTRDTQLGLRESVIPCLRVLTLPTLTGFLEPGISGQQS